MASLDAKVNSLDADVRGIKVVLENEVRRDLNLLAEGHAAIFGAAALPRGEGSLKRGWTPWRRPSACTASRFES